MSILVNNKAHGFTDGLTVGGKSAHNATSNVYGPLDGFSEPKGERCITGITQIVS
jgi:hypothetical protein